jgi:Family of unknown function (DUF6364)
MKQNITLSLDTRLLGKAKVLAAKRNTSVSRLLAEELEAKIKRTESYERARRSALALMEEGIPLGGRLLSREQLHER